MRENKKKEKESLLNRFKKTLRGTTTTLLSDESILLPTGLLFKVPLEIVTELGAPLMSDSYPGIPAFIESAFDYLLRDESKTEGIFRLSGSSATMKSYKKIIDNGGQVEWKASVDAHNATGLIKMYLRELPEPLLTFKFFDAFCSISSCTSHPSERTNLIWNLLRELPKCNYNLLKFVIEKLEILSRNDADTKMGISNIATLVGPNIAKPREEIDDQQQMLEITSKASIVAGCLLRDYYKLFDDYWVDGYSQPKALAKVTFDYEAKDKDELSLTEGKIVFIRVMDRDGWWEGLIVNDENEIVSGRFPQNYVYILHHFENHKDGDNDGGGVLHDSSIREESSEKSLEEEPNSKDETVSDHNCQDPDESAVFESNDPSKTIIVPPKITKSELALDVEARITQLEEQIANLKVELIEERTRREQLAKIIPVLMKNQDEVLNLLHTLNHQPASFHDQ